MSQKMTYTVLTPLNHDKRDVPVGKTIALTKEQAAPLLAVAAIGPLPDSASEILVGSDKYEAHVPLADGQTIALGDLVGMAHERSELPAAAWNALDQVERDAQIEGTLELINRDRKQAVEAAAARDREKLALQNISEAWIAAEKKARESAGLSAKDWKKLADSDRVLRIEAQLTTSN